MLYVYLAIFLATCAVPAWAGALFRPGEWYRSLDKPRWTPPNVAFPIVWSVLYVLMAIAAARVAVQDGSSLAVALWALQICINTFWSSVFFGLGRILMGAVIIGLLWIAVVATTIAFAQLDLIAAALLLPYLAWGTYAFAINISVWQRNGAQGESATSA